MRIPAEAGPPASKSSRSIRIFATRAWILLVWLGISSADEKYAVLFQHAEQFAAHQQYERAIEKYRAALALRPGAPEALNNLAVMYYAVHRYGDAFETARAIWKSHPEMTSAALIRGMAAVQINRPGEAIEPLQMLLAKETRNRDALLALASARLALGQIAEAARLYEQRTNEATTDGEAWYGLAICLERMAEDASHKLSQQPGGGAYSKRLLGEYLLSAGDSKLAREAFGEANEAGRGSPEAAIQYEKARALAERSRHAFETFVGLAPNSWQAALFLGDVHRQHGELREALEEYRKAAAQQPQNPAPQLGMGTACWELGQFDDAEKYLRETLRLNPRSEQAQFELANIAVRRHDYGNAVPLLQKYLAGRPDAAAARADLGLAYSHTGRYREAAEELAKAARTDDKGEIHFQLSLALRKLGRVTEADAALRKSTEIREAARKREQGLMSNP